jgi:hypothetical protein
MSIAAEPATLITDFVDFLATSPAPAAVVAWRPSEEAQGRLSDLLQRQNAGTLERGEIVELENCIQAEQMLRLLKARLKLSLAKRQP